MQGINKATILGTLGRDPEVRYSPNGQAVANLNIATSRKWKDKQTQDYKEETEWHRIVMYDKQAELAGEYLKKGSKVYIEGRLKTRKWQDKQGKDNYTTEIVSEQMVFLDGRRDSEGNAPRQAPRQAPKTNTGFDDMDSDIPF